MQSARFLWTLQAVSGHTYCAALGRAHGPRTGYASEAIGKIFHCLGLPSGQSPVLPAVQDHGPDGKAGNLWDNWDPVEKMEVWRGSVSIPKAVMKQKTEPEYSAL